MYREMGRRAIALAKLSCAAPVLTIREQTRRHGRSQLNCQIRGHAHIFLLRQSLVLSNPICLWHAGIYCAASRRSVSRTWFQKLLSACSMRHESLLG
jgi:hypothetical protein